MTVMAIDPGSSLHGWCIVDSETCRILDKGKSGFEDTVFHMSDPGISHVVIEMVASYGMAVGAEVFETCTFIGRFMALAKTWGKTVSRIMRRDEKLCLCGVANAKDANIMHALMDRFGTKGTRKSPGWFYGFSGDMWSAYAVAVTYLDSRSGRYQLNEPICEEEYALPEMKEER